MVLWFGIFIHAVLEEAYRIFKEQKSSPPWEEIYVDEICDLVESRLAAKKIFAWNRQVKSLGRSRAISAVNEIGPHLFPLISAAEVRLTGSREFPKHLIDPKFQLRKEEYYEIVGVIDVITDIQLKDHIGKENPIVAAVARNIKKFSENFEVIVDYKGSRRPPLNSKEKTVSQWNLHIWQTQTYGYLRSNQTDSKPVLGGIVIYLNELFPSKQDLETLKYELENNLTDVIPTAGSKDEKTILSASTKKGAVQLSKEYRLQRAIQFVDFSTFDEALGKFDEVVAKLETCTVREKLSGSIFSSWEQNNEDKFTCAACNVRTFCPQFKGSENPELPSTNE